MKELKCYQSYLLEMLKCFDKFCKENKLNYFLAGGSTLGAIRHQGFIPWDDDIDLAMLRSDFEKMEKLMGEKNNSISTSQTITYSPIECQVIPEAPVGHLYYGKNLIKEAAIAPKIDIHPIDGVPQNILLQKIQHFFSIVNYMATYRLPTKNKGKLAKIISTILVKLTPNFMFRFYYKISKKIITGWSIEKSEKVCSLFGLAGYSKEIMPKDYLLPYGQCEFEGELFPIPARGKEYLTRLYGAFMELPSLEERMPKHTGYKQFIEAERKRGIWSE